MAKGNIFENLENKYKFATETQIIDMALDALGRAITVEGLTDRIKTGIMLIGARIGFDTNGYLNEKEKGLVRNVIGKVYSGNLDDEVFPIVAQRVTEDDYRTIELINMMGPAVALPTLEYIFACAYIDGTINDSTAEKLEEIFGMALLAGFFASGLEEVPAPMKQVRLTSLEKRIYEVFKRDDSLSTVDDVCGKVRGESEYRVKSALDTLCEKGILYKATTAVGDMYGLLDSDISVQFEANGYYDNGFSVPAANVRSVSKKTVKEENDRIKRTIYAVLQSEKRWMSIQEIKDTNSYLSTITDDVRIFFQITELMFEDKVERKVDKSVDVYASTNVLRTHTLKGEVKAKIYDVLEKENHWMRIQEIKDADSSLSMIPDLRISAILTALMKENKVAKKVDKRVNWYASTDGIAKLERRAELKAQKSEYLVKIKILTDDISNATNEVTALQQRINVAQVDIARRKPGKINIIGRSIKEQKKAELLVMKVELSSKKDHLDKLKEELAKLEKELQKVQKDLN